jgi:hypothetical protein
VTAPSPDVDVKLTAHAEREFRLECERVGAFEIDRDEAKRCSTAAHFWEDATLLLEAVIA